jgi:hypothetical protein
MIDYTPRHLKIDTYFWDEIKHVKDHVHLMYDLCFASLDELRAKQLEEMPDWQRLTQSREGRCQILFGSLELLKLQLDEEVHRNLVALAKEATGLLYAGDRDGALAKFQAMTDMKWSKRSWKRMPATGQRRPA